MCPASVAWRCCFTAVHISSPPFHRHLTPSPPLAAGNHSPHNPPPQTPQVVITDASWPQRGAFLAALSRCLDALQCRAHWYPGSAQRRAQFTAKFPQAQALGQTVSEVGQPQDHLQAEPWLLVTGVWAAVRTLHLRSEMRSNPDVPKSLCLAHEVMPSFTSTRTCTLRHPCCFFFSTCEPFPFRFVP